MLPTTARGRIHICIWSLISTTAVAGIFAQTAVTPPKTGSIQGTVVGSDGTPLAGARVSAGLKANVATIKAPPTLLTKITNSVTASPGNTFSVSGLPAGAYVLCAETSSPGWLDPCHWSANMPVINLAAGQNLAGQTVVMTKGAVVQVRINDPSKVLTTLPGAFTHDVEVLALGANNLYYNARVISTDATGRTHELTLPFNASHTFIVRSQQFALADSNGAALPAAGHTQPLQISSSAVVPQFVYTVTGRLH